MPPQVTKIPRLRGYRVFQNFEWPADLPEFKRFNLIYGWNGSGKTALSDLFRCVEQRISSTEGEVQLEIDGATIRGEEIQKPQRLPKVRVFNSDFVRESVFKTGELLHPIYYVGKENIEKQKQLAELREKRDAAHAALTSNTGELGRATAAAEKFCIDKAKEIKEILRSGGENSYNTYDRRSFLATANKMLQLDEEALRGKRLPEERLNVLHAQKDARKKDRLPQPDFQVPDPMDGAVIVGALMLRTVVSATLAELTADPLTANWVKTGLMLHKTENGHDPTCRFCGQTLSDERVRALEGHFNDQYEKFLGAISDADDMLAALAACVEFMELPDKAALYEHLVPRYVAATDQLREGVEKARECFGVLRRLVAEKREAPFKSLDFEPHLARMDFPDMKAVNAARTEILEVVAAHNAETAHFEASQKAARRALEEHYVAGVIGEVSGLRAAVVSLEEKQKEIREKILPELGKSIIRLEAESFGHELPAQELTEELASYLGRKELLFESRDGGYVVTRADVPARHLSEGEKTAIAFLYFLKSLKDKDFDLANSIVVIDDPISSLDANAIYSAFGFMCARTKGAGQLFVLTHNFTFFRQVKNWLGHMNERRKPDKEKARMYMLTACDETGCRSAALEKLDPLLRNHETEYHYLFKLAAAKAREPKSSDLGENYGVPNLARKLLESFLAFRYPTKAGLRQQIEQVTELDAGIRARITRFLHAHSHNCWDADQEHDPSILAEAPAVMREVMRLIQCEDPRHYTEMIGLIGFDPLAGKDADGKSGDERRQGVFIREPTPGSMVSDPGGE